MRTIPILALALALPLAGCRRSNTISFEQFVSTTVDLRRAAARAGNPAEFQAQKAEVERKHRVTDADLDAFTRAHVGDVKLISAAWDSVQQRLDRLSAQDVATMPTPQPPPGGPRGARLGIPPGGIPAGAATASRPPGTPAARPSAAGARTPPTPGPTRRTPAPAPVPGPAPAGAPPPAAPQATTGR